MARRVSGSGFRLLLGTPMWPWLVCYISGSGTTWYSCRGTAPGRGSQGFWEWTLLTIGYTDVAMVSMLYIRVFERYNMVQLPWDSPWTWLAGFLGVDFAYYWVHRCGHG